EVVPLVAAARPPGVEPVSIVPGSSQKRRIAELRVARIGEETLTDVLAIEMPGALHLENAGTLGRAAEQRVERRHAAVVEIREVCPDARQRRRRVSAAFLQRTLGGERTAVERVDERVGHDVEARAIRADVAVDAGPVDVAPAVVRAVTAMAADFLRVEQRSS